MRKIISFAILAVMASSSTVSANSPFGPVRIQSVAVSDANMLVVNIYPDGEKKHTENCDDSRKNSLVINSSSPYEKEMFAIALAAHASGKKIEGWANGCHKFFSGYKAPKLTLISIQDK